MPRSGAPARDRMVHAVRHAGRRHRVCPRQFQRGTICSEDRSPRSSPRSGTGPSTKRLSELVDWQIKAGTHGLVPVGTTGEIPTLSHDEHRAGGRDLRRGRRQARAGDRRGRLEFDRRGRRLTRFAEKVGADAVLSVVPYYNKPTQEGLFQHFSAIARRDRPADHSLQRSRPHVVDLTPDTMERLRDACPQHRRRQGRDRQHGARQPAAGKARPGFHPALGRGHDGARLQRPWRPRLHLGDLQRRAQGSAAQFQTACQQGNFAEALTLQDKLLRCTRRCSSSPTRPASSTPPRRLGLCANEFRLPLVPVSPRRPKRPSTPPWRMRASLPA